MTEKRRYYSMALKKPILSRLFNSDSDSNLDSDSDLDSDFNEDMEQEIKPKINNSEDPSPQPDSSYLRLEMDHPINKLWRMRTESSDWIPAPAIRLAVPPGQQEILSPEETKKELSRLLFTVSSTANKRLIRATSQDGKEEDSPSPDMDAEVVVFTTSGDLTAWLLVYPPIGDGVEVDRSMLEQALRNSGVNFGIDEELLDILPGDSNRYFQLHLAARGEAPVNGEDGYIEDLFSRNVDRTAKMNDSGKIDYTELNLIQNINKGDTICRIIPPTTGTPGTSVLSRVITHKDGKPAQVPLGRNTELSEDGSCLIASLTGRVEFSGRSFQVKPILEIKGNVDYSTGNINFLGDVDIQGDICTGFNVKALGNITVGGVVEACKVEAGGDLILQKGVKGDNQAIIQAHRNIYAKYLETCNICAKENLQSDCIINCNVYSDGSILADSGRGVIIGGKLRAANTVSARTIGTKAEVRTTIGIGGMPSAEFELECLKQEITELTSILEILEQQPDSPAKLKGLPTVRMKLSVDITKLRQYEETLKELDMQEYVQRHNDARRFVCDTAHPGTELSIGHAAMSIKTETRYCTAALIDGEVRMI